MTMPWLLTWWNLIFIVPFVLAMLYMVIYMVSGLTFGDADADADAGADADASADVSADASVDHDLGAAVETDADVSADADAAVDHDMDAGVDHDADASVDHDADASVDHDADASADHDADSAPESESGAPSAPIAVHGGHGGGGHAASPMLSALAWLGVGRVPLSILLMVLLMVWGAIGFLTNLFTHPTLSPAGDDWQAALLSLPLAGLGSLLITKIISAAIARWAPLYETSARRRHALIGATGEALYPIDQSFGMAVVRDDRGERFQIACRTENLPQPIAKGSRVKLVAYNANQNLFYVIPIQPPGVQS